MEDNKNDIKIIWRFYRERVKNRESVVGSGSLYDEGGAITYDKFDFFIQVINPYIVRWRLFDHLLKRRSERYTGGGNYYVSLRGACTPTEDYILRGKEVTNEVAIAEFKRMHVSTTTVRPRVCDNIKSVEGGQGDQYGCTHEVAAAQIVSEQYIRDCYLPKNGGLYYLDFLCFGEFSIPVGDEGLFNKELVRARTRSEGMVFSILVDKTKGS